jgi:hypothetical protein
MEPRCSRPVGEGAHEKIAAPDLIEEIITFLAAEEDPDRLAVQLLENRGTAEISSEPGGEGRVDLFREKRDQALVSFLVGSRGIVAGRVPSVPSGATPGRDRPQPPIVPRNREFSTSLNRTLERVRRVGAARGR